MIILVEIFVVVNSHENYSVTIRLVDRRQQHVEPESSTKTIKVESGFKCCSGETYRPLVSPRKSLQLLDFPKS